MSEKESNTCPRCHTAFTCRADEIHLCQCSVVTLNDDERKYISERFDGCLCANCMKEMQQEYLQRQTTGIKKLR